MKEFEKNLTAAEKELSLEILDDLSMGSLLGGNDPVKGLKCETTVKFNCTANECFCIVPKGNSTCMLINTDCNCVFGCDPPPVDM